MSDLKLPQIFKPEDFFVWSKEMTQGGDPLHPAERLARVAQQIFKQWLSEQKLVYGRTSPEIEFFDETGPSATHQGYLIAVQEIEQKPCEHEPYIEELVVGQLFSFRYECKHCGKKLKATFTEVE